MFPPIDHLFVPVDFSRSSRAAVELARGFVAPDSGKPPTLELVHVLDDFPPYMREVLFPFAGMGEDEAELEHDLCARAQEAMEKTYELDTSHDESAPTPRALVGKRDEAIAAAIASSNAQLVVMGAFGQGGAVPESIGSTPGRILRQTTRPVLLTRSLSERKPRIRKILCAIDLTPSCGEVVEWAMNLAIMTGAEVETIFVLPDPLYQDPNSILSGHIKFQAKKVLDRERHKLEALFERTYKSLELPFSKQDAINRRWKNRQILAGDPATVILERADRIDADVIAIGTRNLQSPSTTRLGRVSWTVTRSASTHLLAVPLAREANLLEAED